LIVAAPAFELLSKVILPLFVNKARDEPAVEESLKKAFPPPDTVNCASAFVAVP